MYLNEIVVLEFKLMKLLENAYTVCAMLMLVAKRQRLSPYLNCFLPSFRYSGFSSNHEKIFRLLLKISVERNTHESIDYFCSPLKKGHIN